MIASLFGTVRALKQDSMVIDVNGVGYLVQIAPKTSALLGIGRNFQIYTAMVVREDAMTLYGFTEMQERELFELVQTVSGIGPKVALAITAAMTTDDLADAINNKDEAAIAAIPGIGKKSAQRMILELAGKMEFGKSALKGTNFTWREQLVEALMGLGFNRRQSESAVNDLASGKELSELSQMKPAELLKLALSSTNSQKGLSK